MCNSALGLQSWVTVTVALSLSLLAKLSSPWIDQDNIHCKVTLCLLRWCIQSLLFYFHIHCPAIVTHIINSGCPSKREEMMREDGSEVPGPGIIYQVPQVWASIHIMHSVLLCAPIKHSYHKTIIKANLTQEKLLLRSWEKKAWDDGILKVLKIFNKTGRTLRNAFRQNEKFDSRHKICNMFWEFSYILLSIYTIICILIEQMRNIYSF